MYVIAKFCFMIRISFMVRVSEKLSEKNPVMGIHPIMGIALAQIPKSTTSTFASRRNPERIEYD